MKKSKLKYNLKEVRKHIEECEKAVGGATKLPAIVGTSRNNIYRWKTETPMKGTTAIEFELAVNEHCKENICDRDKLLAWNQDFRVVWKDGKKNVPF